MRTWFRRLRGIGGIALTWSVIWATLGAAMVVGQMVLFVRPFEVVRPDILKIALAIAAVYAIYGFLVGALFGSVLAFAERRRTVEQLNSWRIAGWGAVAGAALPLVVTAVNLILGSGPPMDIVSAPIISGLLGATCAGGTLKLARAGSSLQLRGRLDDQGRIAGA